MDLEDTWQLAYDNIVRNMRKFASIEDYLMSIPTNRKSMSDIMPLEKAKPPVHKCAEFINTPLVLIDFTEVASAEQYRREGNETYYVIQVVPAAEFPVSDQDYIPIHITVGGYTMRKQMKAINRAENLPLNITIRIDPADGKTLYME